MTTNSTVSRASVLVMATDTGSFTAKAFFAKIRVWRQRARSRRDLMCLNQRELWDLCLSRADAQREANKPFWRE